MAYKHIIDLSEIPEEKCKNIIELANKIINKPNDYKKRLDGKILATLFYEPSTRTQLSFQAAMYRLGGQVIGFDNPQNSSVAKGENLKDTAKIVSGYADLIVVRNPFEGAAKAVALNSSVPVINAGDGGHLHPTQTLADLVTLYHEIGRYDNLTIGFCGDLKNGRTVHSLIKYLIKYRTNKFVLISTSQLQIPDYIRVYLENSGCEYKTASTIEETIGELDVLYMTRIQKERFLSVAEYLTQSANFILDNEKLKLAKKSLKILHPLPRVDEIAIEVDDDERALYFKQAMYGMYGRMALLISLIEDKDFCEYFKITEGDKTDICQNKNCVTQSEKYLKNYIIKKDGLKLCEYCDSKIVSSVIHDDIDSSILY